MRHAENMNQAVLLLDYEPRTAARVAEALTSLGCEIMTAKDVDASVAACAKVEPRLVLTTSVLPRLKVEDAITQLRARAGLRHTPFIVMMSGYNGQDPKADAAKLGAQDIVAKPFSNEELLARVSALLSRPRPESTVNPDTRAEMLEALRRGAGSAKAGGTVTSDDLFGDLLAEEHGAGPADTQRIAIPPAAQKEQAAPPADPTPPPQPPAPPKPPGRAPEGGNATDKILAETLANLTRPVASPKPAKPREPGTDTAVDKLLSDTLSGLEISGLRGKPARPAAAPEPAAPPAPAPPPPAPPSARAAEARPAPPAPPPKPAAPKPEPEKGKVPLLGGTPFGQYELIEPIATGGMAEVYRARMKGVEGFQKIVAIKRILAHLTDNDEFVTMFVDEAKLAAQLQHPNIIHIYDLGKIDRSYYIAMEYIDGKDLRSILRTLDEKKARLPLGLALFIGSRLAAALDYAHRKRDLQGTAMALVHRDVSPQNVLISYDGDIKLCDFGIAKAASKASHTRAGALKGKLQYMSPEQAWGRDIDHRSDIFSLGLVLYEMLTGRKAFVGDSELSILEQVRAPRLVQPRDVDPSIPPEVERVVLKALKENREERYQTAADLASDLVNILQSIRPAPGASELGSFLADLVGRERPVTVAAAPAARPAPPPPPAPPVAPRPAPGGPPKPKPELRIPVMAPVKEETPAEVVPPPSGIRPGPVLAVVLVVLAIVAVVLYMTRTKRPAASPAAVATPVPETIEMAREAAQREVAKQTQALRERLAGEILGPTPAAHPQPAAQQPAAQPAAVKQAPAQTQPQAAAPKPTTAAAAKQPPAQQAPAQAQPAAAKPTTAPAAAPEPTTAPPEPEPTEVPPTPVPAAAAPAVTAPKAPPTQAPVQVGDLIEAGPDVVPPQAISKTPPTYPALAARQRLGGVVTMDVLVDENGNVQDVKVVKGIKPDLGLDAAAVNAVKTWRFRPATKNGVRVKVHVTLTTTFKL